ncbi:unnamed protein product [Arctia plantaginis]|uniref:Phorbol-ester/DAG-type domain-containing protein n=1 Tax=Arctia plantaginis TaxID=874455 RepID=A0A8S1BCG6_ARCPL|nr:unnamed protein product [Arctia plantaginis]
MQLQVQATNTQLVADTVPSAKSRQSDKTQSSTCADEDRKKMKNKATPGIKIKSISAKQRECQVPQVQSTSSQQVQPQDQSSSAEQVQSKIESKTTLLEKETKKKFKIEFKAKENKKKAVGKENTMKKMNNEAKSAIKIKSSSLKQREWHCIYCSEIFVHPPSEDWIQCNACEEWCHEKCAYKGGKKDCITL